MVCARGVRVLGSAGGLCGMFRGGILFLFCLFIHSYINDIYIFLEFLGDVWCPLVVVCSPNVFLNISIGYL